MTPELIVEITQADNYSALGKQSVALKKFEGENGPEYFFLFVKYGEVQTVYISPEGLQQFITYAQKDLEESFPEI